MDCSSHGMLLRRIKPLEFAVQNGLVTVDDLDAEEFAALFALADERQNYQIQMTKEK